MAKFKLPQFTNTYDTYTTIELPNAIVYYPSFVPSFSFSGNLLNERYFLTSTILVKCQTGLHEGQENSAILYHIIYHIIYNSYKCTGTHKAHKCTNSGPKTQRNISA